MEGIQNKFFYTTFHHQFQATLDIFGNRFHFEGKNDVGISQVRLVKFWDYNVNNMKSEGNSGKDQIINQQQLN